MKEINKNQSINREKVMLMSLLLSAPGPIVTGIPAILSHSATQIADFLRRTAELVALFVSWWIYRKHHHNQVYENKYRNHMEHIANLSVSEAMICSGMAMIVVGVFRLFIYNANGNVIMGLIIAALGLLTNSWFWWLYRKMTQEKYNQVIAGQEKLYRAKTCVDLCVVTALTSVAIAPNHPATQYIDAIGCVIVAFYLLYNGVDVLLKSKDAENHEHKDLF
ncbi:cation transporter [Lutispora thermophila]|uniref:Cation efflux family protein n=1 Tax=Lutispora thermophila DSM 19022 TaxID=1122184 RepID=A0A1M6EUV1_9FIRM|nr:cation transporter [Lutispora thermophila]SHI89202.1 Cation efflux family protein [Lutispora thermophila DSM 19022]